MRKRATSTLPPEKTLKPIANFLLSGDGQCVLTAMANNEKAWTWGCNDFSDEEGG